MTQSSTPANDAASRCPDAARADGIAALGAGEFASAFRHAGIGMILLAPDSRRLQANPAYCRMLGYSEAELLGRPGGVTHADDVAGDLAQRERCIAGLQDSYRREKRYLHRDGHVIWADQRGTLVRDAQGAPLHFVCQVLDISERKRAERALRESEARFRSLTMLSANWYWEQDAQFRFTSFEGSRSSPTWRPDETLLIGHTRWEIEWLHPIDTTWEEHRALLDARRPFQDLRCLNQRFAERPIYLSSSGEPVFDDEGVFRGYRGTTRDITAECVAEEHLHGTQAFLRMAARMGRMGAWAYRVGDERVTWSDELCALQQVERGFTPTPDEVIAFFAPEYQDLIRTTFGASLSHGAPFDVEAQAVTAHGRTRWLRVIGEAERDAQGCVRRLQGACQDITESKRAAEESRQLADQLATTLESLTDAFFTLDRDWRMTYLNPEAERLMRRPRAEVLGKRIVDEFTDPTAAPFLELYRRARDEDVPQQAEEYYAPLGVWVNLKVYPSSQGLAVYARDVTDRVLAQQDLLRLNTELEGRVRERTEQLQVANSELEAFSYAIAHDLRAPLSAIEGFSERLEQEAGGVPLPGRSAHYLRRIRAGVRHMRDLTGGLLSLASLSQASLRCKPVDLALLAQAAIVSCRERSPGRRVDVRIAPVLPAHGDPRLLGQAMENLVGNAWKFTGPRARAQIEVGSTVAEDGTVTYFVRDNGAGFDGAYAAKLFEPFKRLHTQEEFEGTGIGLAIVHKVVSLHGGRIWADSAPGDGATFFFTLRAP
jgi:PAS domain S-box-containing protein